METGTTFKEVDDLCEQIAAQEKLKDGLEAQISAINKVIMGLNSKGMALLEGIEKDEYICKWGSLEIEKVESVKKPETPEDEKLFMEWVKENGYFNKMSMHHGSLNAIYKSKKMESIEEGLDPMDFSIPGIKPPVPFFKLKFKPTK